MLQETINVEYVNLNTSMLLTFPIASFSFNLQPYIFPVFFEGDEEPVKGEKERVSSSIDEDAVLNLDEESAIPKPLGRAVRKPMFATGRGKSMFVSGHAEIHSVHPDQLKKTLKYKEGDPRKDDVVRRHATINAR
jgi:hypothetical protein